ncbi:MAG TPA: ATP-binding protein [Candidatus Limnocylindrales bacterium]|jgi:two-component system sensor histidine kinase BaeS
MARGGMRRGIGCLVVLMATLVVSIGVLVLWLLSGLLGLSHDDGLLATLARPAGLVVLVVGIVALVIGIRIARSVVPPLSELVDAAGRIEAADYSVRVAEPRGGRGELRGLTRAFNEMAARLEAEDATRRRLLADVSHELRTPLAVIQGNLEALLDGVYPPDEVHIGPILDEVRVMERLVDDLRTLSLAEAGALPLHREPTDPSVLLDDVAAAHRARAEAASVAIKVAISGTLPSIDVDPVRIRQVISNLVDNAIRAIAAAGTTGGTITLSAAMTDRAFSIEVVDDGPGIPPEMLSSVFDRFTKSAESRGSGLGLAIARAIVTAHGGTITAAVATGNLGTAMRIVLPVEEPSAPRVPDRH